MSYCRKEGKDQIIFATEEDHKIPSKVPFPDEDDDDKPVGLVLPDGKINWECPCLGGMATGPCGVEFREAFSCFHYSKADPKGSDCLEPFRTMAECMSHYPGVYGNREEVADDDDSEGFMSAKSTSLEARNGNASDHTDNSNTSLISSNSSSNPSSTSKGSL
ncbi:UNVERIFIED_CONTAM: hypothetical protein RMT77_011712 [Armadillidium vulgare]